MLPSSYLPELEIAGLHRAAYLLLAAPCEPHPQPLSQRTAVEGLPALQFASAASREARSPGEGAGCLQGRLQGWLLLDYLRAGFWPPVCVLHSEGAAPSVGHALGQAQRVELSATGRRAGPRVWTAQRVPSW